MKSDVTNKVLVTGAGGFIGSHVVEELLTAGYEVRALVHYNGGSRTGHLAWLDDKLIGGLEIVFGDVRDGVLMRSVVQGCDAILHLAALIGIPYSYAAPQSYIETNVVGVLNILEAARANDTARVVITSTSEVYGSAQRVPIDEEHPLSAQSPYSASKIGGDKLGESYFRSFGLPLVTLRPFNTYGSRQSARAVLPAILAQLLSGAQELHLGEPVAEAGSRVREGYGARVPARAADSGDRRPGHPSGHQQRRERGRVGATLSESHGPGSGDPRRSGPGAARPQRGRPFAGRPREGAAAAGVGTLDGARRRHPGDRGIYREAPRTLRRSALCGVGNTQHI